jgi:hypothetical protein
MLTANTCAASNGAPITDLSASTLPANVVWIDLFSADAAEVDFAERASAAR